MQKSHVVKKLKSKLKTPDSDYSKGFNEALDAIRISLVKGQKVTLRGFGTFRIKQHKARNGRNPKTQQALRIPAQRVIKFTPAKKLKDAVKNQYSEKTTTVIDEK